MPRSKTKIIIDILEVVKSRGNSPKTKIIRTANLDWDMSSRYLETLIEDGFLESEESQSKGNGYYSLTERGEMLLKSLKKIRNVCSVL